MIEIVTVDIFSVEIVTVDISVEIVTVDIFFNETSCK